MDGDTLEPRERLDEFEIEHELGHGSFGVTYLARDLGLDRRVAIKEYLPRDWAARRRDGTVGPRSPADAEDYRWGLTRFLEEARALARFDHPHLVRVHRVLEARGTAYLAMEYVEGPGGRARSLADELREEGTLPEPRVRELLRALISGLGPVHAAGLVHRDIKPSNVMLRPDGSPVLIDFGSARQMMGRHSEAVTSVLTPGYAPIEQYSTAGGQGPWTDIYALGAVAYAALSGRRPDDATERIRNDRLLPLAAASRQPVSAGLAKAVDAALAVDERARPQSLDAWRPSLESPVPGDAAPGGAAQHRPRLRPEADLNNAPDFEIPPPPPYAPSDLPGAPPHVPRAAHLDVRTGAFPEELRDDRGSGMRGPSPAPPGPQKDIANPWWRPAARASGALLAAAFVVGWMLGLPDGNTATGPEPGIQSGAGFPASPRTRPTPPRVGNGAGAATGGVMPADRASRAQPATPSGQDRSEGRRRAEEARRRWLAEGGVVRATPEEAEEARLGLGPAARRAIQAGLAAAGFDPGAADGVFGPRTRAALRRWQADRGVSATGYLTLADASALRAAAAAVPPLARESGSAARSSIAVFSISGEITNTLGYGDSRLEDGKYVDDWSFYAEAGEQFAIWLDSDDFDTVLRIRSPAAEIVESDDDGGDGTNSFVEMIAAYSGRYVVEATSFSAGETGDYDLAVWTANRTKILEDPDSTDTGIFFAESGSRLDISVTSDDFDAFAGIVDPSGEIVATDDDSGVGLNSRIEMIAEDTGLYLMEVGSMNDQAGAYEVFVSVR